MVQGGDDPGVASGVAPGRLVTGHPASATLTHQEIARRLGSPSGREPTSARRSTTRGTGTRVARDDGKIATAVRETGTMFSIALEALRQQASEGIGLAQPSLETVARLAGCQLKLEQSLRLPGDHVVVVVAGEEHQPLALQLLAK